ncbi:MAG TPA: hypothetical protein VFG69_11720, partial [Nannocystaceae bacterium]|nr:hypothetical protein [Nannocystaceae bacterium]
TIRDKALARAAAQVSVPSLGGLRTALHPWIDLPAMSGAAGAELGCTGGAARLDCTAEAHVAALAISQARVGGATLGAKVALQDGRPRGDVSLHALDLQWADRKVHELDVAASGDRDALHVELAARAPQGRASVSADVAPGERTVVDLRHLAVKSHPLWVKLDGASRVTVTKGQAEIDGLDLVINGGRVHVDGALGERNDARVAITRFDLSALDVLDLPVALDGVFEARGRFRGSLVDPQIELAAGFHRLRVADQDIGRVDVDLGLRERHAIGAVRWHTDGNERASIDANVDLRRFDHPRGPGLAAGRPIELVAEVEGVRLARLRDVLDDEHVDGLGGLTLRVSGTPERPDVALAVTATDARVRDLVVQRLEVTASHVDGRVEATVDAGAPWLDGLRLAANAPARLRLSPPYFRLDKSGDIDVAVAVNDLQLRALQKLRPELHLTGEVAVDFVATVHGGRTQAELSLVANDVALDQKAIGAVTLAANAGDERVKATLQLRGAAARLVEARVDLPLALAPLRGQFRWRKEADQLLELDVQAADVGALARLAGISGYSGTLDGAVRLTGPAATPEILADLRGTGLVASARPLGSVELKATHGGGRVEAHVRQSQGVAQRIALDAALPLAFDLGTGKVAWNETGDHDLDVHAIGVDEHILAQFVALPDEMTVDVTARLAAHGHPAQFEAKGEVRANVGQPKRVDVPIFVALSAGPREQSAKAVIGPFGESTIELSAAAKMPLAELVHGKAEIREAPLVAKLESVAFPLHALTPLMPAAMQGPDGRLDLLAGVTGTLGKPVVRGKLEIRDGRITVVPMRQRFDEIHLAVQMRDHDIILQTLTARSGPGRASAKGQV